MAFDSSTYRIDTIAESCPLECPFSEPLEITTPRWGDVLGSCYQFPCIPPDKSVDVTTDVTSVLQKFQNVGGPEKARADVEPSVVDFVINIADVTHILDAFGGEQYPFTPSAAVLCTEQ